MGATSAEAAISRKVDHFLCAVIMQSDADTRCQIFVDMAVVYSHCRRNKQINKSILTSFFGITISIYVIMNYS